MFMNFGSFRSARQPLAILKSKFFSNEIEHMLSNFLKLLQSSEINPYFEKVSLFMVHLSEMSSSISTIKISLALKHHGASYVGQ